MAQSCICWTSVNIKYSAKWEHDFDIEIKEKREFLKVSGFTRNSHWKDETAMDMLQRDLMGWITWSNFDISAALNKGLMDL